MGKLHILNRFRVQKKLFLCILPIIIISYLYFLICFYYVIDQSKQHLLDTNRQIIVRITEDVDDFFTRLNLNIDILLYSTQIPYLFSENPESHLSLEKQTDEFIQYLTSDNNARIQRVYFFDKNNDMVANSVTYASTDHLYTEKLADIQYDLAHSAEKIDLFFYQTDNRIITVAKNIYSANNPLQIVGTVIIEIDAAFFDDIVSSYTTSDTFFVYLIKIERLFRQLANC